MNALRTASSGLDLDAQARAERKLLKQGGPVGDDVELEGARDLTPVERITLDGQPARAWEFELAQGGKQLQIRQLLVKHDGENYVMTLTAVPKQFVEERDAFQSIVESWRWR